MSVQEWVEQEQGKHFCQCGCGQEIKIKAHHHKPSHGIPKYRVGHANKGIDNKVELKCENCGSKYNVHPYRSNESRFCSVNCKNEAIKVKDIPKAKLYKWYVEKDLSLQDISDKTSISRNAITRMLNEYDIPIREPGWGSGKRSNRWQGGRTTTDAGYIMLYQPDHPNAFHGKYVFEHRLVAEKKLGRLLREDEVVHHADGDKKNNCPDNLIVMTRSEHARIHAEDRST